jgi:hypothetical protein
MQTISKTGSGGTAWEKHAADHLEGIPRMLSGEKKRLLENLRERVVDYRRYL